MMFLQRFSSLLHYYHEPLIEKNFDKKLLNSLSFFLSFTILFFETVKRFKYQEHLSTNNSLLLAIGILFLVLPLIKEKHHLLKRYTFSILLIAVVSIRFFEVDIMTISLKNMFPVVIFGVYMLSGLSLSLMSLSLLSVLIIFQPLFDMPASTIPYTMADYTFIFVLHTSITLVILYLNHLQMKKYFTDFIYKKKDKEQKHFLNTLSNELNPLLEDCIQEYKVTMIRSSQKMKEDKELEKVYFNLKRIEKNNFDLYNSMSSDK